MILRIKRRTAKTMMASTVLLGMLLTLFMGIGITGQVVSGVNITNVSVLAVVNVTNTEPNITAIIIDDDVDTPAGEVDLVANSARTVFCNATVFDYNGAQDIVNGNSNATLFIQSVGAHADDDNNHHYTNSSCAACTQLTATTARCSCQFAVQYYANDSNEWMCQMTVTDVGGTAVPSRRINLTDTENSSTVTVTKLLAINTSTLIDYGNLSVTETSNAILHNVTNVGNIDMNLTLRGYGGTNETTGQNLSMVCDFGNISIGAQRYFIGLDGTSDPDFDAMINLTNQTIRTNMSLPQRVDDVQIGPDQNTTIWKLQVPLSVGGICNGTIIFGALEAYQ